MKKLTLNRDEWKLVGYIGVDSGLCFIADPCYILHKDKAEPGETPEGLPASLGKDWGEFCDKLNDGTPGPTMKSFPYALGHEGLGICVSTGFGDGCYNVYAHVSDEGTWGNRVGAIFIDFMGNAFGDEDEEELKEAEEIREVQALADEGKCPECGKMLDSDGGCTGASSQRIGSLIYHV